MLSRLTRRTHLFPYLKSLLHSLLNPEGSSNKFINSGTGWWHNFTCDLRNSKFRQEFSTKPLSHFSCSSTLASNNVARSNSLLGLRHFSHALRERKSRKMVVYLTALAFAMVGPLMLQCPCTGDFAKQLSMGALSSVTVEEKIARHEKDQTVTSRYSFTLTQRLRQILKWMASIT